MIYICMLNLFVDYVVYVLVFEEGGFNCIMNEVKFLGGKGINVFCVLKWLGVDNKVFGFVVGFIGIYIEDYLKVENIEIVFIRVDGDICINVKLKMEKEIEING